MNFRIGQKVVCIDGDWILREGTVAPREGETYTVRDKLFEGTCPSLRFVEIVNQPISYSNTPGPIEPAFDAECFRPVVERKTDTGMAILTKILTDCPTDVNAPAKADVLRRRNTSSGSP